MRTLQPQLESRTAVAVALTAATLILAVVASGCGESTSPAPEGASEVELDPDARRAVPIEEVPNGEEDGEPVLATGDRIVVAGDSLPSAGSELPFPELLAGELGGELEVTNLAEPGTTTRDWLPGKPLFKQQLEPALEGADLLLLTLGGNDLEQALDADSGPAGLEQALSAEGGERVLEEFEAISRRLRRIITAARRGHPELEVAFVSYPDYSRATAYRERLGRLGVLAFRASLARLNRAATRADPDVLVDLLTVTSERDVDRLLADDEHLSDAGHQLYAKTIVEVLGGGGGG